MDMIDVRCPNCNHWLCAVSANWQVGTKIKLKCTRCKKELIFPSTKADYRNTGKVKDLADDLNKTVPDRRKIVSNDSA